MFSKRCDGVRIKGLSPIQKIMPYIMVERNDAEVYYEDRIDIAQMEEYIKRKKSEGVNIGHMDVVAAAIARVIAEREELNRFVMNKQIYARKNITVSLALKKTLEDSAEETTVKFNIKPTDTIFDVSRQIQEQVSINKEVTTENITDKLAKFITSMPRGIISFMVGVIKFMDKHNIIPKSIVEASPFHTSVFITNVGSIGINSIYHHIYNFGTTSMFLAMGMKRSHINSRNGEAQKYISFKFVCDERICDGLYYARSFLKFRRYLLNPSLLEKPVSETEN